MVKYTTRVEIEATTRENFHIFGKKALCIVFGRASPLKVGHY